MDLSRREALHRLTLVVGGALSAPTLGALLSGCRAAPPAPNWAPQALTGDQVDLLGVLVDHIIPNTETPGAREVGVPAFVDTLLHGWVDPDERDRFLDGLSGVDEDARSAYGVTFREASTTQQHELLTRLDDQAAQARENGTDQLPFFARLKEWTLVGYYTSEIGATQELQWSTTFTQYDGDLPLEEVGRTWA